TLPPVVATKIIWRTAKATLLDHPLPTDRVAGKKTQTMRRADDQSMARAARRRPARATLRGPCSGRPRRSPGYLLGATPPDAAADFGTLDTHRSYAPPDV